jgi:hypothetical protein
LRLLRRGQGSAFNMALVALLPALGFFSITNRRPSVLALQYAAHSDLIAKFSVIDTGLERWPVNKSFQSVLSDATAQIAASRNTQRAIPPLALPTIYNFLQR